MNNFIISYFLITVVTILQHMTAENSPKLKNVQHFTTVNHSALRTIQLPTLRSPASAADPGSTPVM